MNKIASCFEKATKELLSNYKRTIKNGKNPYGIYWTEQDLVAGLVSRIKKLLKERSIEVHLNVCINKEFDYIKKHGSPWVSKWRRRFVDIVILDEKKKEGDDEPFSLVAEMKFSYRKRGQSKDEQVIKQVERDIERLNDLKNDDLCREAFFFYLDEYHKDEHRKEIKELIKAKCGQMVKPYYELKAINCDAYGRQI